jgi:hypothetical protein
MAYRFILYFTISVADVHIGESGISVPCITEVYKRPLSNRFMQFFQKSKFTPAFNFPKVAVLVILTPKFNKQRLLPNKEREKNHVSEIMDMIN